MYFKYKNYVGKFYKEETCWFGRVALVRDIVTFQGDNLAELRVAFEDSVEDYLDWCGDLC